MSRQFHDSFNPDRAIGEGGLPGDKQDENLATIRMRKMTPAA
jgi:hypothetical protein